MIEIDCVDHMLLAVASLKNTCDFDRAIFGVESETLDEDCIASNYGQQKFNLHPVTSDINSKAKLLMPGSMDLSLA